MLLVPMMSAAQTSANYEEDTRYLYEISRWEALVQLSERALTDGFETYAIRIRYAVALLETGRWNEAEGALKKAIDLNPFDQDAKALLRNLYLKTGRHNDADRIRHVDFLRMVAVEYGQKISDSDDVGRLDYADVSLRHRLAKGSTLTWSAGGLQQGVYWGDINQIQGYLRLDQALGNNWDVTAAITALKYSYSVSLDDFQDNSVAWVRSFEIGKRRGAIRTALQVTVVDIYGQTTAQTGVRYEFYPGKWASWKMSFNPFISYADYNVSAGITGSVHWYHVENMEIALSGYYGNAYNTVEEAGYIVNNSLDLSTHRTGIYLQRNLYKHLPVFFLVQYERREERFFGFPYNSISWFAGLKYQL
jgi:tetratricopeptide (TPR) repeat protein